jgi:hypothetical protein
LCANTSVQQCRREADTLSAHFQERIDSAVVIDHFGS